MSYLFEIKEEPITNISNNTINVKQGDIWQLGRHRLLCGDCTIKENIDLLMNGNKADMVFTDPPYGINVVSSNGKIGGDKPFGKNKHTCIIKSNNYKPVKNDDTINTAKYFYELIKDFSNKDDIIVDGFLGSGSTLIACEHTNRICYGMEIDEHYCSVIIERWQKYTNKKAVKLN